MKVKMAWNSSNKQNLIFFMILSKPNSLVIHPYSKNFLFFEGGAPLCIDIKMLRHISTMLCFKMNIQ